MNFQYVTPVPSSADLLDFAFRKAREKGKSKKLSGNWLQIIRKKEGLKLDVVKDNIVPKLENVLDEFPEEDDLTEFYVDLMRLTLDYPLYKKSCGAVAWAIGNVRTLHKQYVSKVIKEKDRAEIKNLMKQFYGRLSSILKQIQPSLDYLNTSRKILRSYPDVKDMFTVCLYGFPNVGKTTLLNKLTGTKAEVDSYAFTTKSINAGSLGNIQLLDVPGTLARKQKMNTIERQAELVLDDVADAVIYVFDLSDTSGFSVEDQIRLYNKIKSKNVIVYVSKQDITPKPVLDSFSHAAISVSELKRRITSLT